MNRVLGAIVFSILSSTAVALAAQVSASKQQNGDKGHGNELLRCIYTPQADTQSSSLPTTRMGFKFSVERNNNNEVAADTYTLNESSLPIKQVGHAELTGGSTTITATTKASDILSGVTIAEDSPFDFEITLANLSSASQDGRFSATVESVTTFTGVTYTQIPVDCRLAPSGQGGGAEAKQPTAGN